MSRFLSVIIFYSNLRIIFPACRLKTEKKGVKVTISFTINFKQEKATVNRLLRESTATG